MTDDEHLQAQDDAQRPRPGDIVKYNFAWSVWHWGVFIGQRSDLSLQHSRFNDDWVVELNDSFTVHYVPWALFHRDEFQKVQIVRAETEDVRAHIVERATSKVLFRSYRLWTFNCESFARWCQTKQAVTLQSAVFLKSLIVVAVCSLPPIICLWGFSSVANVTWWYNILSLIVFLSVLAGPPIALPWAEIFGWVLLPRWQGGGRPDLQHRLAEPNVQNGAELGEPRRISCAHAPLIGYLGAFLEYSSLHFTLDISVFRYMQNVWPVLLWEVPWLMFHRATSEYHMAKEALTHLVGLASPLEMPADVLFFFGACLWVLWRKSHATSDFCHLMTALAMAYLHMSMCFSGHMALSWLCRTTFLTQAWSWLACFIVAASAFVLELSHTRGVFGLFDCEMPGYHLVQGVLRAGAQSFQRSLESYQGPEATVRPEDLTMPPTSEAAKWAMYAVAALDLVELASKPEVILFQMLAATPWSVVLATWMMIYASFAAVIVLAIFAVFEASAVWPFTLLVCGWQWLSTGWQWLNLHWRMMSHYGV